MRTPTFQCPFCRHNFAKVGCESRGVDPRAERGLSDLALGAWKCKGRNTDNTLRGEVSVRGLRGRQEVSVSGEWPKERGDYASRRGRTLVAVARRFAISVGLRLRVRIPSPTSFPLQLREQRRAARRYRLSIGSIDGIPSTARNFCAVSLARFFSFS